jgi:archaellum biogenesis ATPase FlaH
LDSLLPDGVPVPCTLLIAADPGAGSELLSNAIMREHLASSIDVKALWISLENFVDDIRNMMGYVTGNRLKFIDCYSNQIGANSKERYSADPSNLPHLGVVVCEAIREMEDECSLLVLDTLSSLIQKVGVRRSTEFFRWLVAKTRSIGANMLTTINRGGFSEATLATFIDIADAVLELAIPDSASSASRVRLRKVRGVKHVRTWLPYEIDFDHRTLRCDMVKTIGICDDGSQNKLAASNKIVTEVRSNLNCEHDVGQSCAVAGRALLEHARLAVIAEEYRRSLQIILDNIELARGGMKQENGSALDELFKSVSKQLEKMNGYLDLLRDRKQTVPFLRELKIADVIRRAVVPNSVKLLVEPESETKVMVDPTIISCALTGVIDAAIHEMPTGGRLSIRDTLDGNMVKIIVKNAGPGQWIEGNHAKKLASQPILDNSVHLGLLASKRLIEIHKGQFHIENDEDMNPVYTIKLPIAP